MDDYAALISVIPKKPKSEHKKPGRKRNETYSFHPDHPLYGSHVQQLRSKPHIPLFIGRPPKPPGPRPKNLTTAWKAQARRFARYILILLRPWHHCDGQQPGLLKWAEMCNFIRELQNGKEGKGQTFLGRITLSLLGNIILGLRTNNQDLAATQDYRFRAASNLNRPDDTSALPTSTKTGDGSDIGFRCAGINGQTNETEQTASDEAFGIISQFRNEANADDIIDSSTFRHLQYLTNTAAALNGILAILPTKH